MCAEQNWAICARAAVQRRRGKGKCEGSPETQSSANRTACYLAEIARSFPRPFLGRACGQEFSLTWPQIGSMALGISVCVNQARATVQKTFVTHLLVPLLGLLAKLAGQNQIGSANIFEPASHRRPALDQCF